MPELEPAAGQSETIPPEQLEALRADVVREISLINNLVEEIGGGGASIDEVLPIPPVVRSKAPVPDWSDEQIASARRTAEELDYGAELDKTSGLSRHVVIVAAGLGWKMFSEEQVLDKEDSPTTAVYVGSAERTLSDAERGWLIKQEAMTEEELIELDQASVREVEGQPKQCTEYDLAVWMAKRRVAGPDNRDAICGIDPVTLPFGYEVSKDNPTLQKATGQLISVGMNGSESVVVLRVDQEWYEEQDTGKRKFRYRPDQAALMGFVADALTASNDDADVALIDSNAYLERLPDTIRAGLQNGRQFRLAYYGRRTLAEVKNADMLPAGPELNQLPGSLRVYRDQSIKLAKELGLDELELLTPREVQERMDVDEGATPITREEERQALDRFVAGLPLDDRAMEVLSLAVTRQGLKELSPQARRDLEEALSREEQRQADRAIVIRALTSGLEHESHVVNNRVLRRIEELRVGFPVELIPPVGSMIGSWYKDSSEKAFGILEKAVTDHRDLEGVEESRSAALELLESLVLQPKPKIRDRALQALQGVVDTPKLDVAARKRVRAILDQHPVTKPTPPRITFIPVDPNSPEEKEIGNSGNQESDDQ